MEAYAKFEKCREENAIKYISRYENVANEYDRRIWLRLLLKKHPWKMWLETLLVTFCYDKGTVIVMRFLVDYLA